jgi:hypothetical protein
MVTRVIDAENAEITWKSYGGLVSEENLGFEDGEPEFPRDLGTADIFFIDLRQWSLGELRIRRRPNETRIKTIRTRWNETGTPRQREVPVFKSYFLLGR